MLIKSIIAAAALAAAVTGGSVAIHKFAQLQQADTALLDLASPSVIASPDAPAKLDQAGAALQKVSNAKPQSKPRTSQWVSVDQWGQH